MPNYISVKVPKNKFKDGSRSRYTGVPEGIERMLSDVSEETATDNCQNLKEI